MYFVYEYQNQNDYYFQMNGCWYWWKDWEDMKYDKKIQKRKKIIDLILNLIEITAAVAAVIFFFI